MCPKMAQWSSRISANSLGYLRKVGTRVGTWVFLICALAQSNLVRCGGGKCKMRKKWRQKTRLPPDLSQFPESWHVSRLAKSCHNLCLFPRQDSFQTAQFWFLNLFLCSFSATACTQSLCLLCESSNSLRVTLALVEKVVPAPSCTSRNGHSERYWTNAGLQSRMTHFTPNECHVCIVTDSNCRWPFSLLSSLCRLRPISTEIWPLHSAEWFPKGPLAYGYLLGNAVPNVSCSSLGFTPWLQKAIDQCLHMHLDINLSQHEIDSGREPRLLWICSRCVCAVILSFHFCSKIKLQTRRTTSRPQKVPVFTSRWRPMCTNALKFWWISRSVHHDGCLI